MTAPAISVLTSVYNAEAYLPAAIESVLAQDFADFEFLLLDDGSTDASRAIAEGYAGRDARIRVIARENRGLVASLNQLFAEARAPLAVRFDADDICAPGRFARQAAFLAAHEDHGIVGGRIAYIDAAGKPTGTLVDHPLRHEDIVARLENGPLFCHSAVMVRCGLVLAAGGYRAAYTHCEDYDLWLRLAGRTRMANLPERLLSYRVSPQQVSSRHVVEQAAGAAIAWLAHRERMAGRSDPTEDMAELPALPALDPLFGPGAAAFVRRRVIERVLYAPEALAGEAWDMLLGHIAEAPADAELWRAAARLARAGRPLKAGRLAAGLLGLNPGMAA